MEEERYQTHSRRSYIYDSKRGGNKKKLFAIIGGILIVLIILIIGGVALSGNNDKEQDEDIFATPATQAPTNTPTPTSTNVEEDSEVDPEEEVSEEDEDNKIEIKTDSETVRGKYSILVQNGSGTAGSAGRLADILGDLGYTISGTENADNFDYETTEIHVTSDSNSLLKLLEGDIGDEYTISNTSSDYGGNDDAVIIIGTE